MRVYLVRRVIELLPVLFLASIAVFLLLHLAPGDPSYFVAGRDATPEELEAVRKRMGLDKPLHVQYLIWLGDILQGDLGDVGAEPPTSIQADLGEAASDPSFDGRRYSS